jgi:alanine racemase
MIGTVERAHARIDLAALANNVRRVVQAAGSSRVIAVVKADAYGHGAVPCSRIAIDAGAFALAVHTIAEAEQLRMHGLTAPIVVMGPLRGEEWVRAGETAVEVVTWTPEGIYAAVESGAIGVHLELDSGMGRVGARPEDVPALSDAAVASGANVVGIMTHFATADARDGEQAAFFGEQLVRFRAAAAGLKQTFPSARIHAANSAATFRDPRAAFDMVRCGIALYGCSPFHEDPADLGLRPVMNVVSYVAMVKTIRSRDSVGYGRTWRAQRGTRLGLVPVGYGDGYARALGNNADALVDGRRVPVIGAVSMDQLTVDLGPESTDAVGAPVVLLGGTGAERITAEELARRRGTINYEITCGMNQRLPRVYVG